MSDSHIKINHVLRWEDDEKAPKTVDEEILHKDEIRHIYWFEGYLMLKLPNETLPVTNSLEYFQKRLCHNPNEN